MAEMVGTLSAVSSLIAVLRDILGFLDNVTSDNEILQRHRKDINANIALSEAIESALKRAKPIEGSQEIE